MAMTKLPHPCHPTKNRTIWRELVREAIGSAGDEPQRVIDGKIGDARVVLRIAAEANDATAAFVLATTYDPMVLGQLALRGIKPDAAMARTWYEKASRFGSAEAAHRLELLANRHPE